MRITIGIIIGFCLGMLVWSVLLPHERSLVEIIRNKNCKYPAEIFDYSEVSNYMDLEITIGRNCEVWAGINQ